MSGRRWWRARWLLPLARAARRWADAVLDEGAGPPMLPEAEAPSPSGPTLPPARPPLPPAFVAGAVAARSDAGTGVRAPAPATRVAPATRAAPAPEVITAPARREGSVEPSPAAVRPVVDAVAAWERTAAATPRHHHGATPPSERHDATATAPAPALATTPSATAPLAPDLATVDVAAWHPVTLPWREAAFPSSPSSLAAEAPTFTQPATAPARPHPAAPFTSASPPSASTSLSPPPSQPPASPSFASPPSPWPALTTPSARAEWPASRDRPAWPAASASPEPDLWPSLPPLDLGGDALDPDLAAWLERLRRRDREREEL